MLQNGKQGGKAIKVLAQGQAVRNKEAQAIKQIYKNNFQMKKALFKKTGPLILIKILLFSYIENIVVAFVLQII